MKKKTVSGKNEKAAAGKSFSLKRTAAPSQKVAELKYLPWTEVELETLNPLLQRQLIVGHEVMLARVLLKKGCIIPLHSHVNEQLSYILERALKFVIDGREIVVCAGQVLTIPPNMPHKAEALEDTIDLDIFHIRLARIGSTRAIATCANRLHARAIAGFVRDSSSWIRTCRQLHTALLNNFLRGERHIWRTASDCLVLFPRAPP